MMTEKTNNIPLTRKEQHKIRALIRSWKTNFTWELLVKAVLSELEIKISRQALSSKSYIAINEEYHDKKDELRGITPEIVKNIIRIKMSDVDLIEKIERLEAEVEIKDEQIEKQFALIQRMLANALEIPNYDVPNLIKPRND